MKSKEEVLEWLRDAYAMEKGLEVTLEKIANSADHDDSFKMKAQAHHEETRRHADLVKQCIESLGSDTSSLKTGLAQGMEMTKGLGSMFAKDERVKDALAAYASEHFEIACYEALRVAGKTINEPKITELCDIILPDEREMADWVLTNLPSVIQSYLQEEAVA